MRDASGREPLASSKSTSMVKVCAGDTIAVTANNTRTREAIPVKQEIVMSARFINLPPWRVPD